MRSRPTAADGILLLAVLATGLSLFFLPRHARQTGAYAEINVGGEIVERLPLSENRAYLVESTEGVNRIEIRDGGVSVTEADCPDALCMRQGVIRYDGQSLICLPHRVAVTIRGADGDQPDVMVR